MSRLHMDAKINKNKSKGKLKELSKKSLRDSLTLKKRKDANMLTFSKLVKKFHEVINSFPDTRTGTNTSVEIRDAALGAFSLFFMQYEGLIPRHIFMGIIIFK